MYVRVHINKVHNKKLCAVIFTVYLTTVLFKKLNKAVLYIMINVSHTFVQLRYNVAALFNVQNA